MGCLQQGYRLVSILHLNDKLCQELFSNIIEKLEDKMPDICPCCKQVLPWKRGELSKKVVSITKYPKHLREDLNKVERSIAALYAVIECPGRYMGWNEHWRAEETAALLEACQLEIERLTKASRDHKLLWRIYRRSAKRGVSYAG